MLKHPWVFTARDNNYGNLTHNQRTESLRAKCEKVSKHINIEDLEKGSKLIEQLKTDKTQKQRPEKGVAETQDQTGRLQGYRENINLGRQSECRESVRDSIILKALKGSGISDCCYTKMIMAQVAKDTSKQGHSNYTANIHKFPSVY